MGRQTGCPGIFHRYADQSGHHQLLIGHRDVVILDKEDHASIVDGARLSWGEIIRFPHNDISALEKIFKELPSGKARW